MIYASLWDRLVAHIVIDEHTDCWNWVGATRRHGGGHRPAITVRVPDKPHPVRRNAARVMCELIHGPLPEGHEASHQCEDNWLCICPDHLLPETKRENLARRDERMRRKALEHPDNDPEVHVGEVAEECPF